MGSVKDLTVLQKPTTEKEGLGIFKFSDRYSIFDYGEMPDHIPGKGAALCHMSSYNFRELAKQGLLSHFVDQPSEREMKVKLVRVLDPAKNELKGQSANYLVPLEVIFRNSLPAGSSLLKRLSSGQVSLENFGLKEMPLPGQKLKTPLLDVSTKLEEHDRYMSWTEAQALAQLSDQKLDELKHLTLQVNNFITKQAERIGLEHADGKIEFALDSKKNLILVDVFGTLDENRFLYNGIHVSKQVMRDYYGKLPWYAEYQKKGYEIIPPKADPVLVKLVSEMYQSVCNEWCRKKFFDVSPLGKIMRHYTEYLKIL